MNFSKFSLLAIFAMLSTLAVCYAKEAEKASKAEAVKSEDTAAAAAGSGATTEGGSSDFDIEQLLKLIDALKNQDFDEVDRALKETTKDSEGSINPAVAEKKDKKVDEKKEEKVDEKKDKKVDEKKDKKKTATASASESDEKLEL